ncbi:hypothetical protein ACLKA6_011197 [Drosophila palustris]
MNQYCALSVTKPVLCVGSLSMDLITLCDNLPEEGVDQTCSKVHWQRGGHSSIVSFVLSLLSAQSEFLGMLSRSELLNAIITEMQGRGIEMEHCPKTDEDPGFSTIMVAKKTGLRAVVHCNRNFPYCSFQDFQKLDLSIFGWVHFEARNVRETVQMMRAVADYNNDKKERILMSLRVSSCYRENRDLFDMADYVLFSRQLAMQLGWRSARETCHQLDADLRLPRSIKAHRPCFICSWGPLGAGCLTGAGVYHEMPPYIAKRVVDTHGAGACFTAAFIYATYIREMNLSDAVQFANRVAGHKITNYGYNHIAKLNIYPADVAKAEDVLSAHVSEDSEAEEVICRKFMNRPIVYSDGKHSTRLLGEYIPGSTALDDLLDECVDEDRDQRHEKSRLLASRSMLRTTTSHVWRMSGEIRVSKPKRA